MFRVQTPLPERYTGADADQLAAWIGRAKEALGPRLFILGHHYQRDEVMRWADARGDSFGLSRLAADNDRAEYVVFCGVHFMAESADILTADHQKVVLPDLNAGCQQERKEQLAGESPHDNTSFTTRPYTSVNRKSRPL